jgi:hypothetical protein
VAEARCPNRFHVLRMSSDGTRYFCDCPPAEGKVAP